MRYSVKDLKKCNHKLIYLKVKFNKRQNSISSLSITVPTTAKKNDVILQNMKRYFESTCTNETMVNSITDELAALDCHSRIAKTAAIAATKLHAEQSVISQNKKSKPSQQVEHPETKYSVNKITISQRDTFKSYMLSEKNELEKPLKVIAVKLSQDQNLKSLSKVQLITLMATQLMEFIRDTIDAVEMVCADCDMTAKEECSKCRHNYCENHIQVSDHKCSGQPEHSLSNKNKSSSTVALPPRGHLKKVKQSCFFVGCSQQRNIISCTSCYSYFCKTHMVSANHMKKCGPKAVSTENEDKKIMDEIFGLNSEASDEEINACIGKLHQ